MYTENLGLALTDRSETAKNFLEWRSIIDGTEKNSSMQVIDRAVGTLTKAIRGLTVTYEITIPADGWTSGEEDDIPDGVHVDIPQEDVKEDMIPFLILSPTGVIQANACGMSAAVRSMSGAVRIYAEKAPKDAIGATLLLISVNGGAAMSQGIHGGGPTDDGGGSGYVLPVATHVRLGGVKIGDGVDVESDGTISLDGEDLLDDENVIATNQDMRETLDNVFGS